MSETHAYRRARSVGSDEAPTLVCADAAGSQDQRDADQMCRSWSRTDDVHPRQDDFWLQDDFAIRLFTIPGKMSGRNQTAKAGEADAPKSVTPREQGGLMPFWSFPGRQSLINSRCARRLGRTIVLAALTFCLATAPHAQPTAHPPDTMEARMLACAVCHGTQGQGTNNDYFPRLAGKPAGYLLNQLVAFKDGRRRYPPMNYLLEYLPEAYLRQMADYLAALRPPPPPQAAAEVSPALLTRGRELVTEGDPGRGVPACAGCHGPTFTGMEPAIPGLVGLHASYISAQLGAWRYGTRTAASPDCMQIIAASLSENDVSAVAAWLASLPVPSDPSPVARGALSMPLACGSEPN